MAQSAMPKWFFAPLVIAKVRKKLLQIEAKGSLATHELN